MSCIYIGFLCEYLPIDFILQALSELHDQIPPFPRTAAMRIVEEELGSPVESFFSYISEEPIAAASFGQVPLYYDTGVPCLIKYNWCNMCVHFIRRVM